MHPEIFYSIILVFLFISQYCRSRSFSEHHLRCGGWLNLAKGKTFGWTIKTVYKKYIRGILSTSGLSPLNSSVVTEESQGTKEEGRFFHNEIPPERRKYSGHCYKQDIKCTIPLFFSDLVPGSGSYISFNCSFYY